MFNWGKSEKNPWESKTPLYEWIAAHPGAPLPDEDDSAVSGRLAPGELDGVLSHHMHKNAEQPEVVKDIVRKWELQLRFPLERTRKDTYLALLQCDLLSIMDDLMREMQQLPGIDGKTFYSEVIWFATEAAHRNPVKFGIALLGMFALPGHRDILKELARHEEFTLYAAVSLRNSQPDAANEILYGLAKELQGWGKIHVVERLEANRPEIREWMIAHGCKNRVMNGYLAWHCATAADMASFLAEEEVSPEAFRGAGLILEALIGGGPFKGVEDYTSAGPAVAHYLRHAAVRAASLQDFDIVRVIHEFLTGEERVWIRRYNSDCGWTHELRQPSLQLAEIILRQPLWMPMIDRPVNPSDHSDMYCQFNAARVLGFDLWPAGWAALHADPENESLYAHMNSIADDSKRFALAQLAEQRLPLKQIAAGPALESGEGTQWRAHHALSHAVRGLVRQPGNGQKLIAAGAHSPVIAVRAAVIRTLLEWPSEAISGALRAVLAGAAQSEPHPELREQWQQLIPVATPE